jgi:hypothetical protein
VECIARIIVSGFAFNPPSALEQYRKDIGPRPTAIVLQQHAESRSRSKSPGRKDTLKRQYSTSAVRGIHRSRSITTRPQISGTSDLRRQYSTLRTTSPGPVSDRGRKGAPGQHQAGTPEELFPEDRQNYPVPIFSAATFYKAGEGEGQAFRNRHKARLARRAYLRHSFNRMDFIAVVSYWIALSLELTGIMSTHHIYIFRMLACLRIFRLLAVTDGTSVSASSDQD